MSDTTYKVIRFTFNGSPKTVKTGLTLEEAQAHCSREDTHGDGWFDGYDEDSSTCLADDDEATECISDWCHNAVPWNQGSDYCEACILADIPEA